MNRKIISSSLKFEKSLTIKKMIAIYQTASKYDGTIYFLYQHNVVIPSHLSKLVTFLMMVRPKDELKVIVEGTEPEEILNQIKTLCTDDVHFTAEPKSLLLNRSVHV
ncbi:MULTISPECIES: HPr family phosphocarrier protein [Cytobacillus]|uniref:HPr family phosphocarrier protein n=1 Tax=Cytobacillus TaxID=2675230 RepID=UPI001CD2EAFC|nr:HPr family phosphocarrier protein [Cytobacillus kochii]MCA1029094.1 HPr family phosphocarrier protein [Cytobacillus kochii]MCM3322152.1 HPr family phosphocarrier protein [Cytobacillus kochii]MCM3343016.1 HPr family phosphocarrier protein [Cytobacillus kochii]MDM5206837.1 HPr family phosphocarrier protein [Cytobacillus kochii]